MYNAGFSLNSWPFIGGKTFASYNQGSDVKEYYNVAFGQNFQWSNGLSGSASFAYSESQKPDTEFARLFDHTTKSRTFSFGLNYQILRSRSQNLSLGLTYNHRDSEADLLGEPFTRDRLRSVTFDANFDFADVFGGVTQILPSLTQGLKAMRATDQDPDSSSPLARADYFKANLYVTRNQQLPWGISLFLAGEFQTAGTVLPSYEQFSLGGQQFGRGYESGAIESDNGVAGSLELRWTTYFLEKVTFQPYLFVDGGTVWTKGNIDGVDRHDQLSSAGLGFRIWGKLESGPVSGFNLNFFVGKPLITVDQNSSARYVITIGLVF
jgi:hemolysin activation/secretion protein